MLLEAVANALAVSPPISDEEMVVGQLAALLAHGDDQGVTIGVAILHDGSLHALVEHHTIGFGGDMADYEGDPNDLGTCYRLVPGSEVQ